MISATVAGNLGADAEWKQGSGTFRILRFRVASTTKRGQQEITTWVGCSWIGKRAEAVAQYLVKGAAVVVAGELSTSEKEGKIYVNLDVSGIKLMGGRGGSGGPRRDEPRSLEDAKPRDEEDDDGSIPF